jgi:hypothetical protein
LSISYQVYITPLTGENTYGDEVEVTDYVKDTSVSVIRRGLDSTDYDVGAFFYDDVTLTMLNVNGLFNDETDFRSMFPYSRDRAKVRIVYTDDDDETIAFRGLLNEEATRLDVTRDEIQVRVLSRDSIMRTVRVAGGTISSTATIQGAIFQILNQPEITAVLGLSLADINPNLDFTIDASSELENKSVRDALNQLLLVSNSVMYVDEDDNVIVTDREENEGQNILVLYGPYDLKRRQNIIDIKNYNLGKHRNFTAVKVNDTEVSVTGYVEAYGYRQKRISAPFITDAVTEEQVADRLAEEFKTPKVELEVTVPTRVARAVRLLDPVSIDHPLRVIPAAGKFLPIIGQAVVGDVLTPLPSRYGSISIAPEMGFKILEIKEDPKNFTTTLKLRQIGTDTGDGFFTSDDCAIVGYGVIGVATICGSGTDADQFNPSVIGAAQIGYTELES